MRSSDWNYASDIRVALQTRPPRYATNIILITLILFGVGIAWAAMAELEEVTRGDGRVVPSRHIQVVQAPDKGIVEEILIQEGDVVEADTVIVRIDDTDFSSQLGEIRQRRWATLAKIHRLTAETEGAALSFTPALEEAVPDLVAEETKVYRANKERLENEVEVLRSLTNQRAHELDELKAKLDKLKSIVTILDREVEIKEGLFKSKVLPEIDFLELKRQVSETQGEVHVTEASVRRADAARVEAAERLRNATTTFVAEAQQKLAEARAELAIVDESIRGAADRVRRTDLTAPVKGIVNTLNVNTIGAVVQPGSDIVEIVPLEDTLLVETQIRPQDVAFLHPGQDAVVKITAYDFSIYGGLDGKLERISADTTENEKGERFFQIMIRTDKNHLGSDTDPLPIIPGMVASVDILTGKKSVLDYILKPIKKVRDEALRER